MSFVPLPLLRLFVALSCLLPGLAYGQIIVPDVVGSNLGYTFVEVGDPQNPDDDETTPPGSARGKDFENAGVGYVGQVFAMGQSEVTNEMYARFLNAVASTDRLYGLYSDRMNPDKPAGGGIRRLGTPQTGYTYTVEPGFEQQPVSFVSGFDAMRFCNWLHNGMPGDPDALDPSRKVPLKGDQDASSTEDGAYTLLGANTDELIRRNPGAKYFLPDQDEWHKAAYYDPSPGSTYWWFADQTYVGPGGNYDTIKINGVDYRVLKDVKASGTPSHYGTFDQDGNVNEWLDAAITATIGSERYFVEQVYSEGATAGSFTVTVGYKTQNAAVENRDLGFRVALLKTPDAAAPLNALMVEVDEPENLADEEFAPELGDPKLGAVNYVFQMGAYEVTNREYAKFLNAKAREDSFYRLYDTRMGSDSANGGITRTGSNGSYVYAVKRGMALKPVVYVSIFSAMRYCNWLHNGGRADSDMESGAYRLLGNIPTNTANLTRNATARYYLPNANEFYKAAYYDSSAAADATFNYWKFATRSDSFSFINNSSALAAVDAVDIPSFFGTYGQSGNVGYVSPASGANAPADEPTADNTGELLEEANNTQDEFSNRTFRIAAAAGMPSLRPLGDEDGDGLINRWEVLNGLDPRSAAGDNGASGDPDLDGLTNLQELQYGLDPLFKDSDVDSDGDGLSDLREAELGTRPDDKDSDDDLLEDGDEVNNHRTDPLLADTDNDGVSDFQELLVFGTNPLLLSSVPDAPSFVEVGNPGNPDEDVEGEDSQNAGIGYVGQKFEIGTTEVTNLMYARFLNAVARSDALYGLYSAEMGSSPRGGIVRSGSNGSYTYTVKPGFGGRPVNYVSVFDAMRYCNWLHNGMPTTGGQNASTTEDGAYELNGTNPPEMARRSFGAKYFLPDQDEWHKAAYYDPAGTGSSSEDYWLFADRSAMGPGGNFGVPRNKLVGTTSGTSRYGTFDQDGNIREWLDASIVADERLVAVGGCVVTEDEEDPTIFFAVRNEPESEKFQAEELDLGFRVARPVAGAIVTQETVPLAVEVGQPGNLADEEFAPEFGDDPIGAVGYTFQMGAYEVTNREYTKFLNAKAKEDSFYRLYDTRMGSDSANGGITRTGSNGSYVYAVKRGMALKPVVYVSIFSAMRYCNWLHNGGRADSDMESGAYRLLGNIPTNTANLTRNATARYYLPNAGEFYKAAYYDSSAAANGTFDYWKFATRSDTFNTTNNNAKLDDVDFSSMASYFGTYGQSGNVGYQSPGSGANTPAPSPTFTNTGEWLEAVSTNSYIESATTAFRIAAAVGMPSVRPDLDADSDGLSNGWEVLNDLNHTSSAGDDGAAGDPDKDGLLNSEEQTAKTDPKDSDTDIDGLSDFEELRSRFTNPKDADTDDDGLADGAEVNTHKTDPNKADTDGEGLSDGAEVTTHGTSPTNPDTDGDGLSDFAEITTLGTNPTNSDTDGDGMPDGWEVQNGLNPKSNSDKDTDSDNDGLSNVREYQNGTLPNNKDTDKDGMPDGWEVLYALNPLLDDSAGDADADGLSNVGEESKGTNPRNSDTDGDGMPDGWEVQFFFDPTRASDASGDFDADGLTNLGEYTRQTDPRDIDTDDDLMPDGWEVQYALNPKSKSDKDTDADNDGLSNVREYQNGTLPNNKDTDKDGMSDGWEVQYSFDPKAASDAPLDADSDGLTNLQEFTAGSNPRDADTDDDGMPDAWEVANGLNPANAADAAQDADSDGLNNLQEFKTGTNPKVKDSDKDGMPDGWEVTYGLNPLVDDSAGDADGDGLTNLREFQLGTKPDNRDTDADRVEDGDEVNTHGTNPLVADTDNDGLSDYQELFVFGTNPVNSNSLPDVPSFVRVGNPGNPDEDIEGEDLENAGIGYVGGEFEIGITEVTNLMYAKFLNAVAKSDKLYGIYSAEMGSSPRGGIVRTGADGSYLYTVKSGFATRPVNYVSVYDAMRYCNWLHNGSPTTGVQNDTTTEDGAYKLTGDNPPEAIRRSFGAKYFLPDQDEWHKAAYYDPQGPTGTSNDYWFFADRSFRGPGGNFDAPRNKPAGTSSGPSHYGTFDQDGNVREWLDASLTGAGRLVAGGGCEVDEFDGDPGIIFVTRNPIDSEDVLAESLDLGFRVARAVSPSPSTPDRVPAMVKIGLAGNPDDSDGKGRVTYEYLMAAYEVTNEEYTAFLNAAAKSDGLYGLYDTRMDTGLLGGIRRSGADGSFTYSVKPGFGKRPVNYVTVYDAMRYCNWLHNGARPGADTETGAYRLLGNLPPDTARIRRNFGARYFLPNEDEWHKAAYYDPSIAAEPTGNYWSFAVRTDNATPSQIAVGGPSGLVDVNKPGLGSYFGTLGQSGNAAEWTEELSGGQRLVLGGGVASDWSNPAAAMSFYADASQGAMDRGFRIAARADSPSTRIMSPQTISFSKLPARRVIGAKPLKINLRAKASSKLAVEFQITDPEGIATFYGGAKPYLLVTGAGRLTITARQAGGGQWGLAESPPQTIEIVPRQTTVRSR